MVCDRCLLVMGKILNELNLNAQDIKLGEIDFGDIKVGADKLKALKDKIQPLGFEIINDKKSRLIESIKKKLLAFIQQQESQAKTKLSVYLSQQLHHDYSHLSSLFSTVEGVTIEQYFILMKIEKSKELLIYDELSLTEIAFRLGYSSVSHLSAQFKKVTGMSPSQFKSLRDPLSRKSLDKV